MEDANQNSGLETKPARKQLQLRCFGLGIFEAEARVTQAGLKLSMCLRVTLTSWSPCVHLPSTGTAGIHTLPLLVYEVLETELRSSSVLDKCPIR